MYTCCRRTYSVTGHGCENTQKDRNWNLAHKIRCTLGLCHNQERFRNKRYIWMSKERRKKIHWGSKGTTTAVQNFKVRCSMSWTFWHYHHTQILTAKHKHEWKCLLNLFKFVRKASKGLYVCTAIDNTPFSKESKHIFYRFECTLYKVTVTSTFPTLTNTHAWKLREKQEYWYDKTFGQCYTLVVSQYSSATK